MTNSLNLFLAVLLCVALLAAVGSSSFAQSGLNGGKPIIIYNTYGPLPTIKTQTPPSFPGGEDKLNAFVLDQIEEAQNPIKLGQPARAALPYCVFSEQSVPVSGQNSAVIN